MKHIIAAFIVIGLTFGTTTAAFAGPCDKYVSCVCDWSAALVEKGAGDAASTKAQCEQVKSMYKAASPMMAKICKSTLKAFKGSLKDMAKLYKALGVKVPSSCR